MSFTSLQYLLFLGITVFLHSLCRGKAKTICLLLMSLCFYAIYSWKLTIVLVAFSGMVYAFGRILGKNPRAVQEDMSIKSLSAKAVLLMGAMLLPLIFYKYGNGLYSAIMTSISPEKGAAMLVLPMGISYFTFKSIGYLDDVYRGKAEAEKDFLKLSLFVTFFPEMLVGPIDREKNLMCQIREQESSTLTSAQRRDRMWENLELGGYYLLGGYFEKMVVADRLGLIVDQVYSNLYLHEGFTVALAAACYSIQIYLDFAGCTYMAIGTARMMGYELPQNFRRPYLATTVADFWRRWHMSLTGWLRDYIYIPLGGSRKGKIRQMCNVLIVFFVSGLWHGVGLHFVIWGLLNGLMQVTGSLTEGFRAKGRKLLHIRDDSAVRRLWKRSWTFVWMTIAWVFFRAESTMQALLVFRKMFCSFNPWVLFDGTLKNLGLSDRNVTILWISLAILLVLEVLRERRGDMQVSGWMRQQHFAVKCLITYAIIVAIAVLGIYGAGFDARSFIYMNF